MSDLKSSDPSDYFPAKFQDLRPGEPITFGICLYFGKSSHLMLWRKSGVMITQEFRDRYDQRGLKDIWVHRDDSDAYEKYMNPDAINQAKEAAAREAQDDENKDIDVAAAGDKKPPTDIDGGPVTKEGAFINSVMGSDKLSDEEKEKILAKAANEILSESAKAGTKEEQKTVDEKVQDIVKDILQANRSKSAKIIEEVWNLANLDNELEHSVNVATYSVIFAMAFGKISPDLIADLACAGLLHDIGLSQVPFEVVRKHSKAMKPEDLTLYATHLDHTTNIINQFAPDIEDRAKRILYQHHEKFDGKGFPKSLEGFNFDDVAQLVAMSDLVDSISSGQWDGDDRTLKDSILTLQSLEKARSFPEYFNPEVFGQVMKWMKSDAAADAAKNATEIVDNQVQDMVSKEKAQAA